MTRAEAIAQAAEIARAVLLSDRLHIYEPGENRVAAIALARFVLEDIEGAFSPSASSSGGGESPAAPVSAPVSTESLAVSSARNLGGPSGPELLLASWQDERIAAWLESHAAGYEHGGQPEAAQALRKKASQVRARAYLEDGP